MTAAAPRLPENGRQRGLDTLRALAIGLVFVYHYRVFVGAEPDFGVLGSVGWIGVDLFFVLSGYLIGRQLLAGIARGQRPSLPAFYLRRALRTWPAFWVVLAAYFAWPAALGGRAPPPLWRFLSFTQNIGLQPGTAFSHAWSLCIEEQFYLVLPLVLWLGLRAGAGRRQGWLLLGALVAGAVVARGVMWSHLGRDDFGHSGLYYTWVYYGTLARFDEFLPGVAVAMLQTLHPAAWQRVRRHGRLTTAAGLAACVGMAAFVDCCHMIEGYGWGFAMSTFGYSALAWSFALLVVAALSPGSPLHRLRIPGAAALAAWSYSIYLTHKAVAHLLAAPLRQAGWPPLAAWVAIVLACLAVGAALYRLVESPFMAWRERVAPDVFGRPRLARGRAGWAGP